MGELLVPTPCETAEEAWAVTSLSLPIYPGLQDEQVMQVVKAIKQFFGSKA